MCLRDAVCCRVLQCVQSVAVCCSVLQCVAVCCSVLQCAAVFAVIPHMYHIYHVSQSCSVLQCVAECCSVLQLQHSATLCNTEHHMSQTPLDTHNSCHLYHLEQLPIILSCSRVLKMCIYRYISRVLKDTHLKEPRITHVYDLKQLTQAI